MKIYGNAMSTCTRKVLTTLAETGTAYELVSIDFARGEHKQPDHLARQPWGRVPALDDDGFTLFESRAMCRYIAERAGGALVPRDARGRGAMEQWISVETSYVSAPLMKFVYEHVFRRPQPAGTLEGAQRELDHALPILDAHLAKHAYFAGDQFTLADVCYMPYVEYGLMTPAKDTLARYAHLSAWWSRVAERPSWQRVTRRA